MAPPHADHRAGARANNSGGARARAYAQTRHTRAALRDVPTNSTMRSVSGSVDGATLSTPLTTGDLAAATPTAGGNRVGTLQRRRRRARALADSRVRWRPRASVGARACAALCAVSVAVFVASAGRAVVQSVRLPPWRRACTCRNATPTAASVAAQRRFAQVTKAARGARRVTRSRVLLDKNTTTPASASTGTRLTTCCAGCTTIRRARVAVADVAPTDAELRCLAAGTTGRC